VRKFEPNSRHPIAALDYIKYGISIENSLLVKVYMKSRYSIGGRKYHHIFSWIKLKQDEIQLQNTIVHVKVLEMSTVAVT